jgi:hypothetical protein
VKLSISDGQRELDLLDGLGIYVAEGGFQMPVVAREMTYAESAESEGRRRVRSRSENAEGQLTVFIRGEDEEDFWDKVDDLLELVESCHRHKGTVTYEPPRDGEAITWDVEAMSATELPQRGVTLRQLHAEVQITFEVLPYGKLEPVTLVTNQTLDGPIDELIVEDVPGQVDALGLLTINEESSENRDFVEIGVQESYDENDPDPTFFTAGTMTGANTLAAVSGSAGTASRPVGAYTQSGGNSFTIRNVLTDTPSACASTGPVPHKGKWIIRTRVRTTATPTQVRLAWRVGASQWFKEGWVSIPVFNTWLDLEIGRLDIPATIDHVFEARIEAASSANLPNFDVDTVSLIPADRYLRLEGKTSFELTAGVIAADNFNTGSTGALSGRTPQLTAGGNWTGAGDADDFSVVTGGVVTRGAVSDTAALGRWVTAGTTNATDIQVSCEINVDRSVTYAGIVARYVDTNNWVGLFLGTNLGNTDVYLFITEGGSRDIYFVDTFFGLSGRTKLNLVIESNGYLLASWAPNGQQKLINIGVLAAGTEGKLETGGTLATGKYGIYHENTTATAAAVAFDNFSAAVPNASAVNREPALFSGSDLRITHESALTASADGSSLASTPVRFGNYLKLPPATRSGQKSRVVIRSRRLALGSVFPDTGLSDELKADLSVTPRIQLGPATGS